MTQNDSEYKLFLIVNHVKHSKLYNEPIVYQIKSAGGILIKKIKKIKLESVVQLNQAHQTWNKLRLLPVRFTLLSVLPLHFWSTLFYISTTLKAN